MVICIASYLYTMEHKSKLLSGQKDKVCFTGRQCIEKELQTELRKLLTPRILQI